MIEHVNFELAEKSNSILDAYFKAVTSHNINNIISVFDPDAELITEKKTYKGQKSIAEYYTENIISLASFYPEPGERHFTASGQNIAVEIKLHANSKVRCVGDFFTFNDKHITKLHVYSRQIESIQTE